MPSLMELITGPVFDIINKLIPDKEKQAEAQIAMLKLQQDSQFKEIDAALQTAQMQTDVNKVEAASTSVFVAGWRPFIGWICGIGFATQYVIYPLAYWIGELYGKMLTMPQLPTEMMVTMLFGMLGISVTHTYEKVKGVVKGAS